MTAAQNNNNGGGGAGKTIVEKREERQAVLRCQPLATVFTLKNALVCSSASESKQLRLLPWHNVTGAGATAGAAAALVVLCASAN